MADRAVSARQLFWGGLGAILLLALAAAAFWQVEIERTLLDPGVPYQIYKPPPAPDYARPWAWALLPADPERPAPPPPVDVFFVHGTTYKGGRDWNAPIGSPAAEDELVRVQIPNYAGPFQSLGRVFAPRYRQASSYAFTTLRDDAREARAFPLRDLRAALATYFTRWSNGRPVILVGVGQGGELLARAVPEALAKAPELRGRIVAVYLIHTLAPADEHGPAAPLPACIRRDQAGCLLAWREPPPRDGEAGARTMLQRAQVWSPSGQLENLGGRATLCVNPLTGTKDGVADARANLGAANASGLEWGARPAFLPRQASAACRAGVLYVSRPPSPSFRASTDWIGQLRAPPFNLFYADLEADARARIAAFSGGVPAPPIAQHMEVRASPVHRID